MNRPYILDAPVKSDKEIRQMQNPPSQPFQSIRVVCYSGHNYADKPTSFVWDEERYEITEIEREWLEPGEKHFIVQTTRVETPYGEKRFHICYHTREDTWQIKEIQ